jgi:hypothetical protein
MANPYRCTVTIDGTAFDAVSTSVTFSTQTDQSGMPLMGSLNTEIVVWADFHDYTNIPFSTLQKLFTMANVVTRDKIKAMKIEFWQDESKQNALCSYNLNGWIQRFEMVNPSSVTANLDLDLANGQDDWTKFQGLAPQLNHMLVLGLQPAMNNQNFGAISQSN